LLAALDDSRTLVYEHRSHRLLAWPAFLRRAARHVFLGTAILGAAVGIGTLGYHTLGELAWLDAFLNASMILSGMGPVDHLSTASAKWFAAIYALFSGLVFIGVAGVVAAPWVHRLFHWVHLEEP
jgi:hypothetical protein